MVSSLGPILIYRVYQSGITSTGIIILTGRGTRIEQSRDRQKQDI